MTPIIWAFVGQDKPFNLMAFLGMQSLMTLFALPGFIIAFNYWRKNGKWKVMFSKRDNNFIILTPEKREVFDKLDFTDRIRTENNSNAPWNSFEYTTIVNNEGRQIHLSNILISSSDMDKLFGRIEETTEKKGFQIIRDKKITTANKMLLQ
jgi:predicted restriction endonuclease